ncbi:MAG: calcium-binding protein [Gemmatales bacterium]
MPPNYVHDLALSGTGVTYLSIEGRLLTVGGDAEFPPVSTRLNVKGTDSTDYFFIDSAGYDQINIYAGNGDDFVQIEQSGDSHPLVNIDMGNGNDHVNVRSQGIFNVLLGPGDDDANVLNGFDEPFPGLTFNVTGGAGNDTLGVGDVLVHADLGSGDDRVFSDVLGDFSSIDTGDGRDSFEIGRMKWATIQTGAGDDLLNISSATFCDIRTGAGNDHVYITALQTRIDTGTGNDVVELNAGNGGDIPNWVYLGDGNDSAWINGDAVRVWAGAGNDQIHLNYGTNNIIRTESGNDYVYSDGGESFIDLGDGNDTYENSPTSSRDIVLGGNGNDVFKLMGGNVSAFGEAGTDTFIVYDGYQFVSGGAGIDRFISTGGMSFVDLGSGLLNIVNPLPTDQLVKNANNYFYHRNMPYVPLNQNDYLSLIAPALANLQQMGIHQPSSY